MNSAPVLFSLSMEDEACSIGSRTLSLFLPLFVWDKKYQLWKEICSFCSLHFYFSVSRTRGLLTQRCTPSVTSCLIRSQSMGPNAVFLRLPPSPLDSHSVLKACTKVPLYNMCVTKINKHSPSLSVSAPKEKVMQSLAFVPRCPPVLSLSLPRSCSAQETPRPSSPTGSHVVPVCSEGQSDINCGSDVYLLSFYFNLQLSGWWPGS